VSLHAALFWLFALVGLLVLIDLANRISHGAAPRLARIELYDLNTGARIMTLAIPSNGVTRLGVRYFDQFGNPLPASTDFGTVVVPNDSDPTTSLADMSVNAVGDELTVVGKGLGVTGAASAVVVADGRVESARAFFDVQDPALSRVVIDESSAVFGPLPAAA
jgi:hypothetical protein